MAARQEHSNFTSQKSLVLTLFMVICWLKPQGHYALNEENLNLHLYHTVLLQDLLPSDDHSSCNNIVPSSTTSGPSTRKASLRVAHRCGASKAKTSTNMADQILSHDQARVNSIKAQLDAFNSYKTTTNLPVQSPRGNYAVDIGIGTPPKQVSMIFDTASDLTLTQCEPCLTSCYEQEQPIFDPSNSTSYSKISCSNGLCSNLKSVTNITKGCATSTCVYNIQYDDGLSSEGSFATESLTLSGAVLNKIPFGCGQNQSQFLSTAGVIGLGRHPLSIVSQTANKYGKVFSYCLPSTKPSSRGGHLSFGSTGLPANLKYTPFSTAEDLFYKIKIIAIRVGRHKVPLSQAVLKRFGESILDTGTTITVLPASIYNPMRDEFKKQMSNYPLQESTPQFDTCYDFTDVPKVKIPAISFYFSGNVKVDIRSSGILIPYDNARQVCLAFAVDDSVNIFGTRQQQTWEVVYDVGGGRIGFAPFACS